MRLQFILISFCVLVSYLTAGTVIAGQNPNQLNRNPFDKPAELAQSGNEAETPASVEDEVGLEISAILVSNTMPLVIATGELLCIGESLGGYRLVAVEEHKAIFEKNGETHTFFLAGSGVETEE